MALDTNLNVDPFYDDFDETKNFHRILFRPSVAVQARELTQLQTILQNQIERFGDNIYSEGTIIQGCNFQYDTQYNYVKLPDVRVDGQPTQPAQYVGLIAYDASSNLQALVVNSVDGYESQNPDLKTLYVKYINSGNNGSKTFSADMQLAFYANNATNSNGVVNTSNYQTGLDVKVAPAQINSINTNPIGAGYSFSVTDGIIFQKGFFIRVANNISVIVSKYNNTPNNVSVGFSTQESIVTELTDSSLYDNASGYSNANAPGAQRLKLTPILVVANSNALPSNNFLSLVDWKNGNIVRVNQNTQYNKIGDEMARRNYEATGDFAVNKFKLSSEINPVTTQYFNAVVGAGLAYVGGYRIEQRNSSRYSVRKGIDIKSMTGQSINTSYGNYILVKELAGYFSIGSTVNLYDTAGQALTNATYSTITPAGNLIGTATVLSVVYDYGTVNSPTAVYSVYLTNIVMNSGKAFSSVKSIASANGIADLVLEYNATTNTNVSVLKEPSLSKTIFPSGKSSLKTLKPSASVTTSFIYKKNDTATVNTTGVSTSITLSGNTQFPYGVGNLTTTQEQSIIVIPTSTQNVTTTTGAATTTIGSANISGTSTTFLSQYQVGDYINVGNTTVSTIKRIKNIANNTVIVVDSNFTTAYTANAHYKCYPKNVPINFTDRNSYINQANNTSITINLRSASNTAETLSNTFAVNVIYDVKSITTDALIKNSKQNQFACIDTALFVPMSGTITCNTQNAIVTTSTSQVALITPGYKIYLANTNANSALIGTVSSVNSTALVLSANATANLTTNSATYSSNNSIGPDGPWPLGFPDIYRLRNVYKISNSNTFTNSSVYDVSSEFIVQTNQTDTTYNISNLAKRPGSSLVINNGDKITAVFDVFTQTTPALGFFSIDSYPIDDANTANTTAIQTKDIPFYKASTGEVYSLRDSIDFRPYVSNTVPLANTLALASSNAAVINPPGNNSFSFTGYITPDSAFSYDIAYYLGRQDKIILNSAGKFSIIEGMSSETPSAPADIPGSMTLGTISIPPYPSLLPVQASTSNKAFASVSFTESQNRRYTMKDIDSINNRVSGLEYYSSLSLLETSTKNLTIKNDITGQDRFKNGIFVDNFESEDGSNISDTEYSIGKNPIENSIVPSFSQFKLELQYDTNSNAGSNTISKTGDVVSLKYTESLLLSQTNSTRNRSLTEGYYNWRGSMSTVPSYDSFVDVRIAPIPQINNIVNITNINNTTNIIDNTTVVNNYSNTTIINSNNQPTITTSTGPVGTVIDPPIANTTVDPVYPVPTTITPDILWRLSDRYGGGGGRVEQGVGSGRIKEV